MLSTDFEYAWEKERPWEDFYREEVVHQEMYKTLFFSYKGQMYQFDPAAYSDFKVGNKINGKTVTEESYLFYKVKGERGDYEIASLPILYDSFKDAVDNARMDDGKTLKDIWYDPQSEYIDFM